MISCNKLILPGSLSAQQLPHFIIVSHGKTVLVGEDLLCHICSLLLLKKHMIHIHILMVNMKYKTEHSISCNPGMKMIMDMIFGKQK